MKFTLARRVDLLVSLSWSEEDVGNRISTAHTCKRRVVTLLCDVSSCPRVAIYIYRNAPCSKAVLAFCVVHSNLKCTNDARLISRYRVDNRYYIYSCKKNENWRLSRLFKIISISIKSRIPLLISFFSFRFVLFPPRLRLSNLWFTLSRLSQEARKFIPSLSLFVIVSNNNSIQSN